MRACTVAALTLTATLTFAGCDRPGSRPAASPVVAVIDGVPIALAAFEDYLAVHFVEEGLEEPVPKEDADRVRSRLFDDFVTESLLVVEADKRGVTVDDAELTAWLGGEADPDPVREPARRVQARRQLATQKLLDAWIRAESKAEAPGTGPRGAAEDAAQRLAASLRARYRVTLHTEALPFPYVPE